MTRAVEAPEEIPGPRLVAPAGSDVRLLVPEHDVADPEVTILVPAVNEELTIGDFVAWCHEGLRAAGVVGEILIVDSSTDRTAEIALAGGARVLHAPKRGLGRAYIDAMPYIRGRYVIMGDADCTYDFRKLGAVRRGDARAATEFAMGSRWKGSIEPGAMPPLHQYFGTPVTTWILNRALRQPVHRHPLRHARHHPRRAAADGPACRSRGSTPRRWCSSRCGWSCAPPRCRSRFLKDREGRLSPPQAVRLVLAVRTPRGSTCARCSSTAPSSSCSSPGIVLLALGLLLTLPLSFGADHDRARSRSASTRCSSASRCR